MTVAAHPRHSGVAARRFGYTLAALVNAALLYAVNVWPGWEALRFLTPDTTLVLGVVNASMLVNLAANLVYVVRDPDWLRAVGDIVGLSVGVAALLRVREVFPFAFATGTVDWALVVQVLLVLGIVGSGVGIVVAVVRLVRSLDVS